MKKYKIQIKELLKLLTVCGFAFLYALGGIEHKWIRRLVAPIWLVLSMFLFSWNWKVFLQAPLLMITLSLGYGAEQLWLKIMWRGIFGLANGATAAVHRNWKLVAIHIPLCIIVCIVFGVFNPFHTARAEELIIGFFIGLLPMYMIKRKENE